MKKNIYLIVIIIVLLLIATTSFFIISSQRPADDRISISENCQNNKGIWLENFQECEHTSQHWCEQNGGTFFECESACRHDPNHGMCIQQCIPVCKFNNASKTATPEVIEYTIANEKITLINGISETASANSLEQKITKVFSTTTVADLNEDNLPDKIVILDQTDGGNGTFFYLAVSLSSTTSFIGTNAILLGDRIAPQSSEVKNNLIITNYAERAPGEPMTTQPSIAVSKYFGVEENQLKEISYQTDLIKLKTPAVAQTISSPLIVSGTARGNWFFEASFPVILTDWDGKIIAQGVAQAKGDWMTTDFVPFEATLTFDQPAYGVRGSLILKKDNPSGLPQNDAALEIPIFFNN
ncbi:MAG: Gmad2 immunoglobulin-like domain-containing protein [Patescibacteria group bacterium]|nr:Gmad2 immunoglobulin-like domain-containing protein [Patescibacteria group bacterium]